MSASDRQSYRVQGGALLLVAAVGMTWIACGDAIRTGTAVHDVPPTHLSPEPIDSVPLGISALERYLDAPGPTPEQRYRAMTGLATLLTFTKAEGEGRAAAKATYRRMLSEFPDPAYRTRTLAALAFAARAAEDTEGAQQALRAAVCTVRYRYPLPEDPETGRAVVVPKPQDHTELYWLEWVTQHPEPLDQTDRPPGKPSVDAPYDAARPVVVEEETAYRPLYDGCAKPTAADGDPARRHLVASLWLEIAGYHGSENIAGGPYELHRALEAYRMAAAWSKRDEHSIEHVMAQLGAANTLHLLQRYRDATRAAVGLLTLLDKPGGPDTVTAEAVRARAVHLVALSVTYADFVGPPAADPYIARDDTLDVELDPDVIEKILRVAFERVRDPKIVPQDRPWTPAVYQALAIEYDALLLMDSHIATHRAFLESFPLHRGAPVAQHRIALAFDRLAAQSRTPATHRENARRARVALTETYGKGSRWAQANAGDRSALGRAAELVRQAAASGP